VPLFNPGRFNRSVPCGTSAFIVMLLPFSSVSGTSD
jgi:hypothetical protein